MASMPELAVTFLGQPSVNSGSTIEMVATILSLRMERLKPAVNDPITEFLVTSLPVPAVVGTAMKGTGSFSTFLPLPTTSR